MPITYHNTLTNEDQMSNNTSEKGSQLPPLKQNMPNTQANNNNAMNVSEMNHSNQTSALANPVMTLSEVNTRDNEFV